MKYTYQKNNFFLLRDLVLIDPEEAPLASTSGTILLPDRKELQGRAAGVVRATGPDVREVAVGDTVLFERFDWSRTGDGGIIISEGEVLAKEEIW